ncbi:site-specific DNA-methyltransferase [Candidatus Sumerlaeota bacterium]|nr:site-specific DNA-methyltransferase [Candidatus Sumerlaeota bacterium]
MSLVEDRSVHLIVTSPPYWQLKDYGHDDQIGFNDTYEEYIDHLNLVWSECHRVLHDGCRLCVNIGDQFARAAYYGRYKVVPIRTEIIRFCETIGFDYMGAIIWQKATTVNTTGGAVIMGSFPFPRNGIVKIDYEFILIFKKPGQGPKPSPEAKEASRMTNEEWNQYFYGHWNFPGARQDEHLAMFPEELPRRLIKMFTFAGETVLDPFLGSGTTSLAAMHLGRSSVGIEKNPDYMEAIRRKLGEETGDMFTAAEIEYLNAPSPGEDEVRSLLERQPYRFRDPVALALQSDPRGKSYGSVIGRKKKEKPPTNCTNEDE